MIMTKEDREDDDASVEGHVNRMLFNENDDSDSSCCIENHSDDELFVSSDEKSSSSSSPSPRSKDNDPRNVVTSFFMDKIYLQHKSTGGSIAEIVWPAAQYLAEFLVSHRLIHTTQNNEDGDDHQYHRNLPADDDNHTYNTDTNQHISMQRSSFYSNNNNHNNNKHSKEQQEHCIVALTSILKSPFSILELGAGLGLTGIYLATVYPCTVLLTDLDLAIPLLHTNIQLNSYQFILHPHAVHAQQLDWGTDDWKSCVETLHSMTWMTNHHHNHVYDTNNNNNSSTSATKPLLLLASDCVYFEHLHEPFEQTLVHILSNAPPTSLCLIAGVRRWKRDTTFFTQLGKRSKSTTHELRCICIDEQVFRSTNSTKSTKTSSKNHSSTTSRCIMRIYAIQWVMRTPPPEKKGNTSTRTLYR